MPQRSLAVLTLAAAAGLASCGETTDVQIPAAVTLAPTDTTIPLGGSAQLRAAVIDSTGRAIAGLRPSLVSSNTAIVTVTPLGLVETRDRIGTASITASLKLLAGPDTILLSAQSTVTVRDSAILARLALSGGPLGIAVGPPGIAYVTLDQVDKVARIDLAKPAATAFITVGQVPSYIMFHPSGSQAYVANQYSHNIGVLDARTNVQASTIAVNGDPVPVAISSDGSTLFTTTNVNRLYKIDLGSNTVVDSLDLPATSHHLLMHPNGTLLYVATRDAGSVLEINWSTMSVTRTFSLGGRTQGMAMSPDAHELYVANETSNVVHIVNLTTGTTAATVPLADGGEGLALSGDGSKLYVGLVFAGEVQIIDRVTRAVTKTIQTGGTPRAIAVDAAGQRMVVANEAGWLDFVR